MQNPPVSKQGFRRVQTGYACIRADLLRAGVTSSRTPRVANVVNRCLQLRSSNPILRPKRAAHHRPLRPTICASLPADDAAGSADSAIPLPYAPFSAELLLAVARLGHLERFRQEVAMFHEPGDAADLTRCALLITNIFQPQLDHRPYYERLEDMVARAALAALAPAHSSQDNISNNSASCSSSGGINTEEPSSLDVNRPEHLLRAIRGINSVVFGEEGLADNAADPYDPLNGSLADVMDSKQGNQYSLAVIYLHVAEALGLPCAVVGSPEHILIRVGQPASHWQASSSSSSSSLPAGSAFLVDVANAGLVYEWPGNCNSSSSSATNPGVESLGRMDSFGSSNSSDINDDWSKLLRSLQQQRDEELSTSTNSSSSNVQPTKEEDEASMLSAAEWEEVEGAASSWQEVGGYEAEDAATRNSWKAMYGPGALAEWGGLVSSSSSSSSAGDQGIFDSWDSSRRIEQGSGSAGLPPAVTSSGAWFGVLESPFAAVARSPFAEDNQGAEGADAATSSAAELEFRAATDSMDTCHGLDAEDDSELLNNRAGSSIDSSSDNSSTLPVLSLNEEAVRVKYGGLAPVRVRVLLQQLLAGMKLSLLLSGRQEEALAVIRYLRATDPFSLPDLRDEALALANMQQYEQAAQLCREYLAVAPGAPDTGMVGEVLLQVQLAAEVARARARKQRE